MTARKKPEPLFTSPAGHPKDKIMVHENAEFTDGMIFVSLNGYPYQIPLGVPVVIPRPVRKMLDTRIKTETRTINKGPGQVEVHRRNIPRVTYTLLAEDVDAALDVMPGEATAPAQASA